MKNYIFKAAYCTIILFLLNLTAFSQDNWTWLNPKPMGSGINASAYLPGTNILVAVGPYGLILRSTDHGSSWSHIQSNLSANLGTISAVNSTTCFVGGDDATLLKTTDAGLTWNLVAISGVSAAIAQIQFVSSALAFLRVENKIYRSTDTGVNWTVIIDYFDINGSSITTFQAVSENKLLFGTNFGEVFSANLSGGWSWQSSYLFSSDPSPRIVKAIISLGYKVVVLSNSEQLIVSSNSGTDWTPLLRGGTGLSYSSAAFITGSTVVAFTSDERITNSFDGGFSWNTPSEAPSPSVALTNAASNLSRNGIILGSSGIQYNTVDSGQTWTKKTNSITSKNLNSIYTLDRVTIWAAGVGGVIIKSTDGGNSWISLTSGLTDTIKDLKFVSALTGYFVAKNKIYKTTDSGVTWFLNYTASTNIYLNEISALNENEIIVVGSSKNTYYTTNGGISWLNIAVGTAGDLNSIHYSGTSVAYCAGTTGKIFKTADKGNSWSVAVTAVGTINSIWFSTPAIGWAVGNNGKIFKSTNSGGNWDTLTSITYYHLQSVRFSDANNGIIVGNSGTILKTTDGGTTWTKSAQVTDKNLMSAALIDGSTVLVSGNTGTVIKSYNAPLPVELISFTASVRNNTVQLNWETATEVDNYGFEIERKDNSTVWTKIGFVEGHYTSNSPKYYNFSDKPTGSGKYSYRLKQIDNDGEFEYSKEVEVLIDNLPNGYLLEQNYPNPFNPETSIKFVLKENTKATLKVYNLMGELVATLFDGIADAGRYYDIKFTGTNLASGFYIYTLDAGKYRQTRKMILLK
ncbi:MAG: T9SS type A sorting domain-containing protein [Ignavibacteria bacterium]|nr:T9SS type A sorting domain-containing protein [Ignavibacteria bacterium]